MVELLGPIVSPVSIRLLCNVESVNTWNVRGSNIHFHSSVRSEACQNSAGGPPRPPRKDWCAQTKKGLGWRVRTWWWFAWGETEVRGSTQLFCQTSRKRSLSLCLCLSSDDFFKGYWSCPVSLAVPLFWSPLPFIICSPLPRLSSES